jgi:hypothetical protein
MDISPIPFLIKYAPKKLEDFVMERNRHYDLLESFFKNPKLSHWYLYGKLGLGITNNPCLNWYLIGSEVNQAVLKQIREGTRLRPSGLFHVVVIDEADAIPAYCRTSLLKDLDLSDPYGQKNTCWIFTSNQEAETGLGEKLKTRTNRVLFTAEGLAKPAAQWLIKIADLEGFVLAPAQASNIVKEVSNNLRDALAELDRRCSSGRLARKDAPPDEMQAAA